MGTHDFASFCTNLTEKQTTVRTIYDITVEKQGDTVILLVKGNGFLYNMVRILVGTLLGVNEADMQSRSWTRFWHPVTGFVPA